MIGKMNSINFKGAYLLKSPDQKTKEEFETVIGKKRQIFEDFNEKGDVLYVTRGNRDNSANRFLKRKGDEIEFLYYPNIDTKCCFSDKHLDKINEKLESEKDTVISKFEKKEANPLPQNIKNILATLSLLGLDIKSVKRPQTGVKYAYGENNKLLAKISPEDQYEKHYVMVEPKNADDSVKFLKMDKNGKILHVYKAGVDLEDFRYKFTRAMEYHAQQNEQKAETVVSSDD